MDARKKTDKELKHNLQVVGIPFQHTKELLKEINENTVISSIWELVDNIFIEISSNSRQNKLLNSKKLKNVKESQPDLADLNLLRLFDHEWYNI